MPKIIRILRSCSMKIFSKFPTVNISKLNFWLVICIAKNFIWTTLKMIFSIFRFFCTLRFQIYKYCPIITNHTSMERWFIQLQMFKKWLLWLVLWSMVTFVYESEWSRTSLFGCVYSLCSPSVQSGTRAVSWTWLSSSVFLYHRLCPSSRASRVSRRTASDRRRTWAAWRAPSSPTRSSETSPSWWQPDPALRAEECCSPSLTRCRGRCSWECLWLRWRTALRAWFCTTPSPGPRARRRPPPSRWAIWRAAGRASRWPCRARRSGSTWTVRSTTASPSAGVQTHSPSSPAPASSSGTPEEPGCSASWWVPLFS